MRTRYRSALQLAALLMTSILFDVKPGDPMVFVAMALGLMAVALGASAVPSLRAVRIQPGSALRHE